MAEFLNQTNPPSPNSSLPWISDIALIKQVSTTHFIGAVTLISALAWVVIGRLTTVTVDPNEPPLLKSSVPILGHLVSFIRRPSDYFNELRQKHKVELATLQLGNAKVYVVWSPAVVQSTFRNKLLSHDKYSLDFAQNVFNLSQETVRTLRSPAAVEGRVQAKLIEAIQHGLMGKSLKDMTEKALLYLTDQVNDLDSSRQGTEISNLYIWLRDHITLSVSNTLYGENDPFRKDPTLIEGLWDFEGNFTTLLLGNFLGKLLASSAFDARKRIQSAMIDFYRSNSELCDDIIPFIRERAKILRDIGIPAEEIGRLEMSFMFVATTGSVPTIFWLAANLFHRPELVSETRAELERLVTKKDGVAELRVSSITEASCPLLISCWHEAIRLGNQFLGTRHPSQDIVVNDRLGRSYTLKKDVPVIWTARALHVSTESWGEDAASFRGNRFQNLEGPEKRKKKASFFPFGGGEHLCPGRVFAFNEILPFTAALLLGFDISNLRPEALEMGPTALGEGVLKPLYHGRESSCRIQRRPGWGDLQWKLTP